MRILIAPDKFKGSLSAGEVAKNVALGLRHVLRDAKIDIVPMADGGEGTAEVVCSALNGSWLKCKAHDPLGRKIDACYAWIAERRLAVMEMSEAAGMWRLSKNERDPVRANTFGVGEMIVAAADHGADEIIIGLGGSATNDGGFGMARELGFGFDYRDNPGAGAAGGLGFGLMSFCGAQIRPGFDVVAEAVELESKMKDVDVVITGEGSLDRQTLEGKTPAGVARLARKLGKRVFAIVGRTNGDRQVREIFDGVCQNARPGMSETENMSRAAEFLRENARELAKIL